MQYFPKTLSEKESDALAQRLSTKIKESGWGLWAVELRDTERFIGFVGLSSPSFKASVTPCIEIGWRLAQNAWGQGFATEAARECLRFGFLKLGLEEIVSFTTKNNQRSRLAMERLGMKHEPLEDFLHPTVSDESPLKLHVLYRLSVAEWIGSVNV